MNVITRTELATLTNAELSGLFARISREVSEAKPQSREWHVAVISLENIRHELAERRVIARPKPRGPGF